MKLRELSMIRTMIAFIGGFFLIFIELYIVVTLKGYRTIDVGGIIPFMNVWAMNFFLLFAISTHIQFWREEKELEQERTYIN